MDAPFNKPHIFLAKGIQPVGGFAEEEEEEDEESIEHPQTENNIKSNSTITSAQGATRVDEWSQPPSGGTSTQDGAKGEEMVENYLTESKVHQNERLK